MNYEDRDTYSMYKGNAAGGPGADLGKGNLFLLQNTVLGRSAVALTGDSDLCLFVYVNICL